MSMELETVDELAITIMIIVTIGRKVVTVTFNTGKFIIFRIGYKGTILEGRCGKEQGLVVRMRDK
jgi:hypothetical protein